MKQIRIVAAILATGLFFTTVAFAKAPPKESEKPPVKPPATIEKTIEGARAVIGVCQYSTNLSNLTYEAELKSKVLKAETNIMLENLEKGETNPPAWKITEQAKRRVAGQEQTPGSPAALGCEPERKQAVIEMAKSVSRAQPKISEKVKDMIAQWLTVMDSIGKPNFTPENSKFETLANRLLLE